MSATTLDLYMRREECSIMLSVGSVYNFQVCLPVVFEAMTHPKIPQQTPHWRHWFNAIQNASQNASKYSKHCHCMPLGAAPVWRCVVPQRGSGHDHDCVPGRWFETFIWFMKKTPLGVNNELKSVEASSALPKRDCRLDGKAIWNELRFRS